jgi:SAM-dependent methyltransferase
VRPTSHILNLGGGPSALEKERVLRGEVAAVVGADIDPIVLENADCDTAVVIHAGHVPLPDQSFDVVLSDFVLEHVTEPALFLREVRRLLKPGGLFVFRTPNRWHYVSLAARLTPHCLHSGLSRHARRMPHDAHEPYRTYYRLNSVRRLRQEAIRVGLCVRQIVLWEAEPSYLVFHQLAFLAGVGYERLVNRWSRLGFLRANIFGVLERE